MQILNAVILILLAVLLFIRLRKLLEQYLSNIKVSEDAARDDYNRLLEENAKIDNENRELKNTLDNTTALYDITKQICKYLDEAKVFSSFNEELSKHIRVQECRFIKGDIELPLYSDYTVLPLKIDTQHIGYLVAKGVNETEQDKFHILASQFLLGIRRSLLYQKIQELAIMDGLTGILSRRYFLERFQEEFERSKKFKYGFAFLMIDVDHFKEYNDRYGHLVGDVILKEVSRIIKDNLRQIDLVGRYGGEEFSIILTETDKEGAIFAAERIRHSLEERSIRAYDENLKVTLSVGVSVFPDHGHDTQKLIEKADHALYQAKQGGRNKVCLYAAER
ncbi:MAG: GGDEF domain-containing protein [Deltaproteobacteria bacterium]